MYAAEQYSNTISVTDPSDNRLVGEIRLGDPDPSSLSPLYTKQLLVHGMGFSPNRRSIAVVSVGSNSVTFIDTATNAIKHVTYVGRSPHEAFFTPDGSEVWVTVRGEDYVSVLDGTTYREKMRITVPNGPGMQIFSPDGKYGYVCSSLTPETVVVTVKDHRIVGHVPQASPFCPNIAATPDGKQVWFTLKDSGKTQVFDARPPFALLRTIDTGPISNHVNFARNRNGMFAYVTIGGLNQVKVFRTSDFERIATISVGKLPHGIWPSGDGTRVYVGLENADRLIGIDTLTNRVIASVPIGQAAQAVTYVPGAVPSGDGRSGLVPLGAAGKATHLLMIPFVRRSTGAAAPTSVTLFDQGILQVLEASVTGLAPKKPYVLALSKRPDGQGSLESLAAFMTNAAGSQVVNAIGAIRQVVEGEDGVSRRYLVIVPGTALSLGAPVQVQAASTIEAAAVSLEPLSAHPDRATRTPIKHVIVVVMEARSFDNMFHGFPGANTAKSGHGHLGQTIVLAPTPYEGACNPDNSHEAWVKNYDAGRMDGFDTTPASCIGVRTSSTYPYAYLPYAEVKPYWDIAKEFSLADDMFASQTGPSYPGHMFIVAGTSGNQTDDPSNALMRGCDAPAGTTVPYLNARGSIAGTRFPCLYDTPTLGNMLDSYGLSWAYYSNDAHYLVEGKGLNASTQPEDAFALVRNGPDWQKDVTARGGVGREFLDIADGSLPAVSWFDPPVIASDRTRDTMSLGPDYNADLVNALMSSPAGYWKDTALFITWDNPGGWYDHVRPAKLDNNGLGFRVPLIVASAYAKRSYVSHVRHEYGSLLKFVEYNWNLPSLGTTDRRADDLVDMFDFSNANGSTPPTPIINLNAGITPAYFETAVKPDTIPLDFTPVRIR